MRLNYFFTILLLSMLIMIAPFSIDAYIPSFNELMQVYNVKISTLQLSIAVYSLCSAISMLVVGYISDVIGRKKIILFGLMGYAISSVSIIFVQDISVFLFFRSLQGFFGAIPSILSRSIIRDLYSGIQAHKAMALLSVLFGISPILAPFIGGYLQVSFGWKSIFLFMAIYGSTLFIAFFLFIPESLPVENRVIFNFSTTIKTYSMLFKNFEFIIKNIIMVMLFAYIGMFIGNLIYLAELLNFNEAEYYLIFIPAITGGMLGSFISGKCAGRIRVKKFIAISLTISCSMLILTTINNLFFVNHNYLIMMLPWSFLFFSVSFSTPVIILNIFNLVDKSNLGLASSFQGLFMTLGFSIILATLVPLINGNITLIYLFAFGIPVLGMIAWIFTNSLYRKKKLISLRKVNHI